MHRYSLHRKSSFPVHGGRIVFGGTESRLVARPRLHDCWGTATKATTMTMTALAMKRSGCVSGFGGQDTYDMLSMPFTPSNLSRRSLSGNTWTTFNRCQLQDTMHGTSPESILLKTTMPPRGRRFWSLRLPLSLLVASTMAATGFWMGCKQGAMECTKNADLLHEPLLQYIINALGLAVSPSQQQLRDTTKVWSEGDAALLRLRGQSSSRGGGDQASYLLPVVATVGFKVVTAAREFAISELSNAMELVQSRLPNDAPPKDVQNYLNQDKRVNLWRGAVQTLWGCKGQAPWHVVVVESPFPAVLVPHILLPQHIIVTTGMLEVSKDPNELAWVIGQEIAHAILENFEQPTKRLSWQQWMDSSSRRFQTWLGAFLHACNPAWATSLTGRSSFISQDVTSTRTKDAQNMADDVGLRLAAAACFDTRKAGPYAKKLQDRVVQAAGFANEGNIKDQKANPGAWFSLMHHANASERCDKLLSLARTEDYHKASYFRCQSCLQRCCRMHWLASKLSNRNDDGITPNERY